MPTVQQQMNSECPRFLSLSSTRGNVREAARLLGCGQATVYRKIKRYGIVLEDQGRTAMS